MDLSGNDGNDEPVIKAYPDYESHRTQTPVAKRINNVIDVYLDQKGLLWALDNGDMDDGGILIKKGSKAKVFAVDVHTDDVILYFKKQNKNLLSKFHFVFFFFAITSYLFLRNIISKYKLSIVCNTLNLDFQKKLFLL